jgi:DNA-binding MarR family transcriptional regulator
VTPEPPLAERRLGRTAAWLGKQVEIGLDPVGLSAPQYRVLGLLDESPAVSSALAERLVVRPSSVTAIVDGLVSKGLVERRTVATDRRRVDHVLTAEGIRVLGLADAAVDGRLFDIAGCLDDRAAARRALDGLAIWRSAFGAWRTVRQRVAP